MFVLSVSWTAHLSHEQRKKARIKNIFEMQFTSLPSCVYVSLATSTERGLLYHCSRDILFFPFLFRWLPLHI